MRETTPCVEPSQAPLGPLSPLALSRARLKLAWDMLAQVAEHADVLPASARAHVATALAELVQAKAILEQKDQSDA